MKPYFIQLLNYERWANQRVIEALSTVNNPPARAIAVMGHILSAQQVWYGRITREPTFVAIWEDIPVGWMSQTLDRQHNRLIDYLNKLDEAELAQSIDYVNSKGEPFRSELADILTHLSHHAAYHRGQVVQLIRPMLAEAPLTDFIFWMREA